ncbi:hypothetical protein [Nitrososphaera viennensis]|uniref:Uncharacterized protein n=2 Tax=Nitrososphaera viennensis TaxID=1034015 RepID=A0A060HE57_9ARCH|nr:hypothetical protein [Nitrososphaera viennensis]AIC14929.1 hypothetical protein NVIE_0733 [Nitrososphaera viennensis EN76]UVS69871.1 hypothetical protein NWT39_03565 [Nitrososphaera viennensis]
MNRLVVPCGCELNWGKEEGEVILCETHELQYEKWHGSVENFIKTITTPRFKLVSHVDGGVVQC